MSRDAGRPELLAKYHDWCSARIADQFLSLSPERVYELAQDAPEVPPRRQDAGDEASYRALVRRVTEALLEEMDLPDFEEWREAYQADPGRYDGELFGFWRREFPGGEPAGGGEGGPEGDVEGGVR